MSRITQTFKRLKNEGRKALIPFITAGDPSLSETRKLIFTLGKAGADIIELGIPFSDPMADGPVIQAASERALKKEINLLHIFKLVKEVRKQSQIPILLMGYYNPIFAMGEKEFSKKAEEAGVDAVLVVDLPPEEGASLRKILIQSGIDLVFLVAPTSDEARIMTITKKAKGFIYYVSLTGVTGAKLSLTHELSEQIDRIRQKTNLPIAIGFGISSPEDAKRLAPLGDGIVVGSALVKLVNSNRGKKSLHSKVYQFIHSLRTSLDSI